MSVGKTKDHKTSDPQFRLEDVLDSIQATAYLWDFGTDEIAWAGNASSVLGGVDISKLRQARAYALHIDPDHSSARYDGVTGGPRAAPSAELPYALQYRFLPEGRRSDAAVWLEDHGVCFTDAKGSPVRAQGTLRVIADLRRADRMHGTGEHEEQPGLLNRTALAQTVSSLLSAQTKTAAKGVFLLVGINDLTRINETYGYHVGDEVISIMGERLRGVVRGRDCLGRFSSNKFGIVLHNCDAHEIEPVARRLMAVVDGNIVDTSAGAVAVTVLVGAVQLPYHAGNSQEAMGRALQAIGRARTNPGDRFCCYVPCERRELERQHNVTIADEIIRALNDRRMMIALQPIVTSRLYEPELYECLLRLRCLDGSILKASEIIPVAEQFGLSRLVDHRALELTVDLLRSSRETKLALNVSAMTLTDRQWVDALEALTGKDRTLTERLTVEISEIAATCDIEATSVFIGLLKDSGCRVALDDFGAGYTSLRSLRDLGVDMVKIDGSLIENLGSAPEDEVFVRKLIDLAHSFGPIAVGEWVGGEQSVSMLEKAGVAYLQGDFFGAPKLYEDTSAVNPARVAG